MKIRSFAVGLLCAFATFSFVHTAHADERTEARRHFRRGMDLVVAGQVEEGIAELEEAYNILPHPNVLYNIGRAYAEAGQYEAALDYFERYLVFGPPDADEVRGFIASLQTRIENRNMMAAAAAEGTTGAAGTTGTTGAAGTTGTTGTPGTSGASPSVRGTTEEIAELRDTATRLDGLSRILGSPELTQRAASLRALADEMERGNAAAAAAAAAGTGTGTTAETGTGTVATAGQSGAQTVEAAAPGAGLELGSASEQLYEEEFVSSTRAAVNPLDAPNSTTIITRQDIRLTGLTAIGELLRRVAGVQVMNAGPAESNIGIRGFNQRLSPRVLLLVNGRSTYNDVLGITIWQGQQVSVEDIERIEVVRGPASALYGANGFSGIVNVITRTPGDDPGTEFSASVGNGGQLRGYLGTSGRSGRDGRIGYRMSVAFNQADRYSVPFTPGRVDVYIPPTTTDVNLGQRDVRAFGNLTYRLSRDAQAYGEIGTIYTNPFGIAGNGVFNDLYTRGPSSFAVAGVQSGWGGVRFFWNNFDVDVDQYGQSPLPLTVRWNTYDLEGTFAHGFDTGSIHHDVVAGAGYRRKFVEWNIIDRPHREDHFQGFAQDSIHFGDRFTLIAGLRVDRHPLLARPVVSPRGAIVGRVGEHQAIRASVSTAFRTQSFVESYLSVHQPTVFTAVTAYGAGSQVSIDRFGVGRLRPERILSAEVGYQNQESDVVSLDAAVYFNKVQDLIDLTLDPTLYTLREATSGTYPADVSGFNRTENSFVVAHSGYQNIPGAYYVGGIELVGRVNPTDGLDIYANYTANVTYLDQHGEFTRQRRAPVHQVNAGVQYRKSLGDDFGIDVALDVHAQTRTVWNEQVLSGSAVAVVPFGLDPLYLVNARIGVRLLDDRMSLGISGYNINAFFGPDLRQHPFTQQISGRVLGSLSYRF